MRPSRRGVRHRGWAVWLAALCAWLPALAVAAMGPPPLRDYAVDAWTSRNGLPHNSIRDIAQTPEGYLWFATWEGVVRYNGVDFATFDRGTRPGLRDNGIGALYVDPHGTLWLSDSRGNLGRLTADGEWRFQQRTPDWPQALIHDMAMDSRGRLWLLFEGLGLGCLMPDGSFRYEPPPAGIPLAASVPQMALDAQDRLWIGTLDGLVLREPDGRWRRAPSGFGLPPGRAWPYRAPDGTLWLAAGERIYRLYRDHATLVRELPGLGNVAAMLRDRNGDLWLGTESQGVVRIGQHGVEHLWAGSGGLPSNRFGGLLEDAEGSIWIGTNGGLIRLRETLFGSYTQRDGLGGDYVRAVLEDRNGDLWIGGGVGLDRMDRDGRIAAVALRGADGEALPVLSLAEGRDGDLWVGTLGRGVFRLRDGRLVRHYGQDEGVPNGNTRAIAVADDGSVWVGTRSGPMRIDGQGVHAPTAPGLPQSLVTALASIDGALWIGTVEGAWVLRGARVERLDLESLGGARSVFGFQKIGGDVWMATDRGLYRYRDGALSRVGLEQGMPVDTVFQLVPDRLGNVWISSNRGELRTRLDALQAAADGRGLPLQPERYSEIDGMPSAQANGSSSPAAILRRDGTLWVATAGGLAKVDPARMQRYLDRPAPPPTIEGVRLDGRDIRWRDGVRLPGGRRIAVDYAGLSYLLPERIRYRVRLLGLDADWVERGEQRSVEFIGLPPGDYILQVQARHPRGGWSPKPAQWSFTVAPLWWQRHDVQAAAALAMLLGLFALYRYRVNRYRTRNLRLARLVGERTRNLQAQTERLRAADREKGELLERLREQAETFERLAREDPLTGLPNRRHFDEVLAHDMALAGRGGRPLVLAMLDLDHFKQINDTHSHAVGDRVLQETTGLLAASCRASDMLARMGGEEFVLLMPDTSLEEAEATCQRLRRRCLDRRDWAGIPGLNVTFSLGLTAYRAEDTPQTLLARADAALYRAKEEGRNRICIG